MNKSNEEFKILNYFQKRKLSIEELCEYYRAERKFLLDKHDWNKEIKFHNCVHPIINILIKGRRIINKQTLTIYNSIPKNIKPPIIFSVTHTGKYDIEIVNEAIKLPYYLLSDDEEYMYRTVDGFVTDLNGVIYVDSDYSDDKKVAKETAIKCLQNGGNVMWFPEGIWNLSANQLMLHCPYGIIEAAVLSNATIIPIAIDQQDKDFYVNIGEPIFSSQFNITDITNKNQKIDAINYLRDIMATLKWQIWESQPQEHRDNIPDDFYDNFQKTKIDEWPFFTKETIQNRVYVPNNIISEEEAFEHLNRIEINTNNAFLLRKKYNSRK